MLRFFCYARGRYYNEAFPVEINEDRDVAALREVIKEMTKPVFEGINAHALVLWKVSVLFSENLKEDVERLNLNRDKSLKSPDRLGDIFSSAALKEETRVQVVVDRPPLGEPSA
jgi:Crinkler effector protein N-terminal domain